jgi:hypothetical protein
MKHYSYVYYIQPYSNMTLVPLTSRVIPAIYNAEYGCNGIIILVSGHVLKWLYIAEFSTGWRTTGNSSCLHTIVYSRNVICLLYSTIFRHETLVHLPVETYLCYIQPYSDMKH